MRRDKGNEDIKRSLPVFTKHYRSGERRRRRRRRRRRKGRALSNQTDTLLPKTLSFITMDVCVSPPATGHAVIPVPSAVGEASTCSPACVYVCLRQCV